jgi:hypothetical protein
MVSWDHTEEDGVILVLVISLAVGIAWFAVGLFAHPASPPRVSPSPSPVEKKAQSKSTARNLLLNAAFLNPEEEQDDDMRENITLVLDDAADQWINLNDPLAIDMRVRCTAKWTVPDGLEVECFLETQWDYLGLPWDETLRPNSHGLIIQSNDFNVVDPDKGALSGIHCCVYYKPGIGFITNHPFYYSRYALANRATPKQILYNRVHWSLDAFTPYARDNELVSFHVAFYHFARLHDTVSYAVIFDTPPHERMHFELERDQERTATLPVRMRVVKWEETSPVRAPDLRILRQCGLVED